MNQLILISYIIQIHQDVKIVKHLLVVIHNLHNKENIYVHFVEWNLI